MVVWSGEEDHRSKWLKILRVWTVEEIGGKNGKSVQKQEIGS
jgi:hypothetical protein